MILHNTGMTAHEAKTPESRATTSAAMLMDGFLQVQYTSLIQYDKDFINHIYIGPISVDSEITSTYLLIHIFVV